MFLTIAQRGFSDLSDAVESTKSLQWYRSYRCEHPSAYEHQTRTQGPGYFLVAFFATASPTTLESIDIGGGGGGRFPSKESQVLKKGIDMCVVSIIMDGRKVLRRSDL